MSFLDVQDIGKRYGTVAALDDVTLGVAAGSRTAIVGPSGSGKTTLLRLIAGFEAPDNGRILLDGTLLAEGADVVPAHRRGIGIVAQDGALFPHLTVADNIGFGLPKAERDRASRIADLVAMVDLDPALLRRKPDQLSGGQQQRVALARALALRPRLMLLDEPFSALDTGLRVSTRKSVEALLGRTGITTILVTHDQEEALSFADQVIVLGEGRLLQAGGPRDLYAHPSNHIVAQFLGEAILLPAEIADGWAHCALGAVRTAAGGRSGSAEIMLRPEQVRLASAGSGSDARGEVIDVDFAGAVSTVTLRLLGAGDGRTICLRASLAALPEAGAIVAITVEGEAHVFPPVSASSRELV